MHHWVLQVLEENRHDIVTVRSNALVQGPANVAHDSNGNGTSLMLFVVREGLEKERRERVHVSDKVRFGACQIMQCEQKGEQQK